MLEIPKKKWYELEDRRDIFLPFTTEVVCDRLINTLSAGGLKRKSFWTGRIKCSGTLTGNFLEMSIGIPTGKGSINYQVYGELVSNSGGGCLVRVAIRDTSPFYTALVVAAFISFIFFKAGTVIGIFAIFFFGGFACVALILQHVFGISAVTKAIRDSTESEEL